MLLQKVFKGMFNKKSKITFLALGLAVFVSACQPYVQREDPQLVASPDRTDLLLADAATRATKALESLASLEQAKNPNAGQASLPNAPLELRRAVTLQWNGPVEPVARLLADRASYRFQTIGDSPPTGILVNVNVRDAQVIEVLRSIGLQLGNRATLKVNPNTRLIEVQYAPVNAMNIGDQ